MMTSIADDFVVDAHAVVWYLESNPRLGRDAKVALDASSNRFVLPCIALAEAAYVVERGRSRIPSVQSLFGDVQADARFEIYPLTADIVARSFSVTAIPELHDRLIVGTALHLLALGRQVALITRDAEILRSGLVPVVW